MGISVCFDQSNDIVSNQPDTPVFPCLPSPSLSHFFSSILQLTPPSRVSTYTLIQEVRKFTANVRDGEILKCSRFRVHQQSGDPWFWLPNVANAIEQSVLS